jgi:hypothetical protein
VPSQPSRDPLTKEFGDRCGVATTIRLKSRAAEAFQRDTARSGLGVAEVEVGASNVISLDAQRTTQIRKMPTCRVP